MTENMPGRIRGITPIIEVLDLKESIEFYSQKLGFELEGVYPETGDPCWASLAHGDTHLMMSIRNARSPAENPIFTGTFYFYPDDVDAAWEALKDAVEVEYPIETFEYGMREFGIRDCNGYLLQFGQGTDELEDAG